jgi:glycosyltransferase involved in cell wall biosynthesis
MYKGKKITVVVPAYNEEELIGATLADVPEFVDSILVVDDASSDATAARVRAAAGGDPRVHVLTHERNQGVGSSVVDGYRWAIENGSDVAAVMAGDHQMPAEHLPRLLDAIVEEGYDAAKGNRFLNAPAAAGRMPMNRVIGNIVLTLLTKIASGYWSIFDSQNGYWAVTTDALRRLDLSRISRRYDLENSMLIGMNIISARIADLAIPAVYGKERSGIRLWRVVPGMLVTLFAGFWRRIYLKYVLYNFHPLALFLFSGLALLLWGLGFGLWVAITSLGSDTASTATVMLAVIPFLLGFQLVGAAIALDILAEPK